MKKVLLAVLVVMVAAFVAMPAFADAPSTVLPANGGGLRTSLYHSYDGLICTDCHTLHNSEGGARVAGNKDHAGVTDWTPGPFRELLKKGDWTDMCLSCHKEGFNTAGTADLVGVEVIGAGWTAPIVMTLNGTPPAGYSLPAGDFYWSDLDPKRGHNPAYSAGTATTGGLPTSKLMKADGTLGYAPPGGAISDGEWSCHSCHGMHARHSNGYTAYRQIKRKVNGIVQTADVTGFGVETNAGDYSTGQQAAAYEPIKSNTRGDIQGVNYVTARQDGNPLEGADLRAPISDTNKNVYRGGFSSFCSTCHTSIHGGGETAEVEGTASTNFNNTQASAGPIGGLAWVKHPTNIKMDQTSTKRKYGINTYKKVVTNSQSTTPNPTGYDYLYPLVQPDNNFDVKSTVAGGALHNDDRIMCLTCHQAHASPFENMTRWDANGHAFVAADTSLVPNPDANGRGTGIVGGTGTSNGDNIAFGCGKCHQKGGTNAFVRI
jgi:hypothetical protein